MLIFYLTSFSIIAALYFIGLGIAIKALRALPVWQIHASSPLVGAGAFILILSTASKLGIPTIHSSYPACGFLLCLSGYLLYRSRPLKLHFESNLLSLPFVAILSVIACSLPVFSIGPDWLGRHNGDMAHYCLSTTRILHYGYYSDPNLDAMSNGFDHSQSLWYMYSIFCHRNGADYVIALFSVIYQTPVEKIYMPLLLALQGVLTLSILGMIPLCRKPLHAIAVGGLASFSYLNVFSVHSQLLPQILGLSISCLFCAQLSSFRSSFSNQTSPILRFSIPAGLTGTLLLLVYPEILPIVLLAAAFWLLLTIWQTKDPSIRVFLLKSIFPFALVMLVVGNHSVLKTIEFFFYLIFQVGTKQGDLGNNTSLFPHMLKPFGLGFMFGLVPITGPSPRLNQDIPILLGLIGLALTLSLICLSLIRRANLIGIMALSFLAMAATAVISGDGFKSFKSVIFCQPWLWSFLYSESIGLKRLYLRAISLFALTALFSFNLFTTADQSLSAKHRLVQQSPFFDTDGALSKQRTLIDSTPSDSSLAIESTQMFTSKLSTVQSLGKKSISVPIYAGGEADIAYKNYKEFFPRDGHMVARFKAEHERRVIQETIKWPTNDSQGARSSILKYDSNIIQDDYSSFYLLLLGRDMNTFNRSSLAHIESPRRQFSIVSYNSLRNHLIPVNASNASLYLTKGATSLYEIEPDTLPGRFFQGFGSRIVFRSIGKSAATPDAHGRLIVSLSTSSLTDTTLPSLNWIGAKHHSLDVVGSGSLRLRSPIEMNSSFLHLPSGKYALLETNKTPCRPQSPKFLSSSLFSGLYRSLIPFDPRLMTCWLRDVSFINHITNNNPTPDSIESFIDGIEKQSIFYSGIFEDGWVNQSCYIHLDGYIRARINGFIPASTFGNNRTVTITCRSGPYESKHILTPGFFSIVAPVDRDTDYKLLLHTSESNKLSDSDHRNVSYKLISASPHYP